MSKFENVLKAQKVSNSVSRAFQRRLSLRFLCVFFGARAVCVCVCVMKRESNVKFDRKKMIWLWWIVRNVMFVKLKRFYEAWRAYDRSWSRSMRVYSDTAWAMNLFSSSRSLFYLILTWTFTNARSLYSLSSFFLLLLWENFLSSSKANRSTCTWKGLWIWSLRSRYRPRWPRRRSGWSCLG